VGLGRRKKFLSQGLKKPIASIAPIKGKGDIGECVGLVGRAMEHLGFEPFGERVVLETGIQHTSHASRLLLWAGSGLFWSLVGAIVLARATYFEPGMFDGFGCVVSLAERMLGVL
jgi:hypothetical protein